MDPILMSVLITVLLLVLIVIGVPVAFALFIAGVAGIVALFGFPPLDFALGKFAISRVATYALTTIPLFILMGQWAAASGLAGDAYVMARNWVGGMHGSLAIVTVAGCAIMGATTGSSVAEIVALGPIVIPEMKKHKYDMRMALGVLTVSGSLATMIPPSIGFVLYGILTGESIGKLFIAGIIPGVLTALIFMLMIYVRCRTNPRLGPPVSVPVSWKEKFVSLGRGWAILLIFAVVVGGLYFGLATPTEVGALGSVVTLLVMFLAIGSGRSSWREAKTTTMAAIRISAMCFAFLIGSAVFSLFMTQSGAIPGMVAAVKGLEVSPVVMLAGICLLYIPLGMFFDPTSIRIVTIPMVYPIIIALGYDGIWFGVIMQKLIEIALVTPPVAINLYAMKATFPEASLEDIIRGSVWFLAMDVVALVILIAFPQLSLWLPNMMW